MSARMFFSRNLLGLIAVVILFSVPDGSAEETEKHMVVLDSVEITISEPFAIDVGVIAGEIGKVDKPEKRGFGSFCIPMKYNVEVMAADSVVFMNTLEKWDEKFTNPKIDTGFISLCGIYDMGGKDNPPVFSPDQPEKIARVFFSSRSQAKPGIYLIELTEDPIQKTIFLGSTNGLDSINPGFRYGIVVLKDKR